MLLSCHPSAYFFVIPVPRHWDPAKLVSVKVANLTLKHNVLDEIAGRLDSSVTRWNDKKEWAFMWLCKQSSVNPSFIYHLNF
ncbi:hypothetical protein [Wolbachia endosymbiont of Dactylopius coccus]